jgi:hypothetical protein
MECKHAKLVLQEGPFEQGTRWVCKCGESFRVVPWGEIGVQYGTTPAVAPEVQHD